jgi:hypothetical protein
VLDRNCASLGERRPSWLGATASSGRRLVCLMAGKLYLPQADPHSLFDHLVAATGKREWEGDAEPVGCLEVDEQLDFS